MVRESVGRNEARNAEPSIEAQSTTKSSVRPSTQSGIPHQTYVSRAAKPSAGNLLKREQTFLASSSDGCRQ